MKSEILILLSVSAMILTGCASGQNDGVSILNQNQNADNVQAETQDYTKPEVPEGAIADDSGNFVYQGKLMPVGDDENGYMQIPLGYSPFQEEGSEGLTQFADATGVNIFTLDYYENMPYEAAAESMRYYMASQENIEGLQGSVTTVNGYSARQLYCHFTDENLFWIVWLIEDPDNPDNSYHLSLQCDPEHQNLIACSSTFQTVNDYHEEQNT